MMRIRSRVSGVSPAGCRQNDARGIETSSHWRRVESRSRSGSIISLLRSGPGDRRPWLSQGRPVASRSIPLDDELADPGMELCHLGFPAYLFVRSLVVERLRKVLDSLPLQLPDLVRMTLALRRQSEIVRSPRIVSNATLALNAAVDRLRVFMPGRPFHRKIHLIPPVSETGTASPIYGFTQAFCRGCKQRKQDRFCRVVE
jgi:hypothetical protein